MDNYAVARKLESASDLYKNPQRVKDLIEMSQSIYLLNNDFEEGKRLCIKGRDIALARSRTISTREWYEIYLLSLKYMARYFRDFDSYLIFLEHNRDPEEQFYLPRRDVFKKIGLVQSFQDMLDDKLDILTISLPQGVGKTTIEEFFTSYIMGLNPDKCNIFSSYSGKITDMFHRTLSDIITSEEYAWREVFPDVPFESKSDKDQYINLGKFKPFKTLTCRSIDASLTGVTRAEGYLMCDDLVSGMEEALSPERLEKLYMKYLAELKGRRKLGAKEIHVATRWSVHDVIGHLIVENEGNDRARFIAVDCYDENGESNFDYKFKKGFDTAYFKEMEKTMDDVTFRCLYRSDPIEREGLLYHKEDFEYYLGGLPVDEDGKIKEPDAILGVCDTKDTGNDFNCLLVGYKYGSKYYLEDVVYDNGSPYILDDLNADCLVRNNVQMCQFESNKEGSRTGNEVQKKIDERGGRCSITKKYTTQNKETKILVNSDWVKKHIIFKDETEWTPMYRQFMKKDVFTYVQMGKNKHDDGVDALAMFALFVQSFEGAQVDIMSRSELGF